MQPFRDRVVLVTGASSGIGMATAHAFAPLGARLLLVARRADRLAALGRELSALGAAAVQSAALDVRDADAVARWFEQLSPSWAEIEVLINSAGLSRGLEPLQRGRLGDWNEMIDTNLKGLLHVTRTVLPGMLERARGTVLHIGSLAGHESYPGGNVYCATKAAVRALTAGMRHDLKGSGVRVGSIDPGMVETEFSSVRFHGDRQKAEAVYRGMTPLTAEDVAEVVLFAASRPPHVSIAELLLLPTDQASAGSVHRRG